MLRIGIGFGLNRGGVLPSDPPPPPSEDFIIKVKTDNAGTSGSNQFTLPTTTGTYDYTIDWGDGTVEDITSDASQTHTYPSAGEYVITISGTFPRVYFNNGGDRLKLIETINFGDVGWADMSSAFRGCENMTINENCQGDLSFCDGFVRSFENCLSLTFFPLIPMGSGSYLEAFRGCSALESLPELDLSAGNNFSRFCRNCSALKSVKIYSFGVIASNFSEAFQSCGNINSFKTRNFYNMTNGNLMFRSTTLPTSDYSDILITQRANNNNNDVTFHGGDSKYNPAGGIARAELTNDVASGGQNWSITDNGPE